MREPSMRSLLAVAIGILAVRLAYAYSCPSTGDIAVHQISCTPTDDAPCLDRLQAEAIARSTFALRNVELPDDVELNSSYSCLGSRCIWLVVVEGGSGVTVDDATCQASLQPAL
jgi:hypothetical protein